MTSKLFQKYFSGLIELMQKLLKPKQEQPQFVLLPIKKQKRFLGTDHI